MKSFQPSNKEILKRITKYIARVKSCCFADLQIRNRTVSAEAMNVEEGNLCSFNEPKGSTLPTLPPSDNI